MRPKSTTEQGRDHEQAMEKLFAFDNARRSKSSGAQWNDNVDISSESFVMECESTSSESYSLKKSFWEEVKAKSTFHKFPTLGIEFRDVDPRNTLQLVVMDANDIAAIMELLREYEQG
jgi:hypothetical protein